ncbi:MAG: S8 family serine peptidase, partial [Candidatus Bathyarchaeota archaeon]|nr:S8 family serine peptidase [Candidatus Bathyarchaeota archaeon]
MQKVPVIIRFKDTSDTELLTMFGGNIKYVYNIIPAVACSVSQASLSALRGNPLVAYVQQDNVVQILQEQLPWGVDKIDAEIVHQYNKGTGVKIAVIDTGIDYDHPDLAGNIAGGKSFVSYTPDYMDDHGHGTHVAGIIAAEDNDVGVVGVAPEAKLYALKALDSGGSGYISDIVAAIDWAVANGIQIISMSFGSNSDDVSMREACNNAYNAGVLLVAAAGNDGYWGRDTVDYPARYDSVIAVAATDQNNNRAYWSSRGPSLELAAPGVSIYSTYLDDVYATASGTSMACPHVSGVAALVFNSPIDSAYDLDNDGVWDASEVRRKLRDTADDLGYAGWDSSYGWGLVDADEAAPQPADMTPPGKVTGLTVVTVSQSQLNLSWNANFEEDIHHYNVYRSTSSGFACTPENRIASTVINSYLDIGLAASTTYYYKVTAVDLAGNEGEPSEEVYGTTSEDAIGPVVSAVVVNPNPTKGAMLVA